MAAQTELPDLSRPTVYRTLVSLIEDEAVREIAVAHGSSWYEAVCSDDAHSDEVCNVCGRIEKVQDPDLMRSAGRPAGGMLSAAGRHVVVYGTCHRCAMATRAAGGTSA